MTDIVITPANVIAGANSQTEDGIAGVAVTAGQTVYKDSTTKKLLLADTNSATLEARTPRGIALHAASLNQPLKIHKSGDITIGGTVVQGTAYYQSGNPGGICPAADLITGDKVSFIGLATNASTISVDIQSPGVVKP